MIFWKIALVQQEYSIQEKTKEGKPPRCPPSHSSMRPKGWSLTPSSWSASRGDTASFPLSCRRVRNRKKSAVFAMSASLGPRIIFISPMPTSACILAKSSLNEASRFLVDIPKILLNLTPLTRLSAITAASLLPPDDLVYDPEFIDRLLFFRPSGLISTVTSNCKNTRNTLWGGTQDK